MQVAVSHRREGPDASTSVAIRLADFVLRRPAAVFPAPVLEQARYLLLDTLGIAIAAGPMEAGRIARDTAALLYGSADPLYSARMLFDGPPRQHRRSRLCGRDADRQSRRPRRIQPDQGPYRRCRRARPGSACRGAPDSADRSAGIPRRRLRKWPAGPASRCMRQCRTTTLGRLERAGRGGGGGKVAAAQRRAVPRGAWHCRISRPAQPDDARDRHATMLHDGSGIGALIGLSAAVLAERGFTGAPAITVEAPDRRAALAGSRRLLAGAAPVCEALPICRWRMPQLTRRAGSARHIIWRRSGHRPRRVTSFHYAATLFGGMRTRPRRRSTACASPSRPSSSMAASDWNIFPAAGSRMPPCGHAGPYHRLGIGAPQRPLSGRPLGRRDDHDQRWADACFRRRPRARRTEAPLTHAEIEAKYMEFAGAGAGTRPRQRDPQRGPVAHRPGQPLL